MADTSKPNANGPSATVNRYQYLGSVMSNILKSFPTLNSVPDILYFMMATLHAESSGRTTAIGPTCSTAAKGGIGYAYITDPPIFQALNDPGINKTNVLMGLRPHSLMQTMGMYHVRNGRLSRQLFGKGTNYQTLAENVGAMVNVGQDISALFPDSDIGVQRSITMGCIVMEGAYSRRLTLNSSTAAITLALGDYLGKEGAKDVLQSTPAMRRELIADPNSQVGKKMAAVGFSRGTINSAPITVASNSATTVARAASGNIAAATSTSIPSIASAVNSVTSGPTILSGLGSFDLGSVSNTASSIVNVASGTVPIIASQPTTQVETKTTTDATTNNDPINTSGCPVA